MPKPQPNFTLDEIVGTLTELSEREIESEGFVTVEELRKVIGWMPEKIRGFLHVLKEEGRLEVGKKRVRFLDDRVCEKPAYRIKSKEEKGE